MNIITFEEVFKDKVFRIPDYQRGYSWTKKELKELWYDLYNTHDHRQGYHFTGILTFTDFSRADIKSIRKEGFVVREGSIYINNQQYQGVDIVDGQQRLTTLLILLSTLVARVDDEAYKSQLEETYFRKLENGKNKYVFGYHIDVPSHNYLIREIFNEQEYEVEETETLYTHNLSFAKVYFETKVAKLTSVEVRLWITKITRHLLFAVLNLSESQDRPLDVSMVFETLNFRGKQLSSLERLKNRVLYIVSKQLATDAVVERSRKRINQAWLEVYKWLGRNPAQALDDDAFLKAFWLLYFSRHSMVSNDFKAYQKHLFTIDFQLETEQQQQTNYAAYEELTKWLDVMKKAVVLWYFINHPSAVETDEEFTYCTTPNIIASLHRLQHFPRGYGKYMLNLVLAIFMRDLPEKAHNLSERELEEKLRDIEALLKAIERHNIMCFLLQGNNANLNLEATFRDINYYFTRGRAHNNEYLIKVLTEQRVDHFRWKEVSRHINKGLRFQSWTGNEYFLKTVEFLQSGQWLGAEVKVQLVYPEEDDYEARSAYKDINSLQKLNRDKYSYSVGNMFLAYTRYEAGTLEQVHLKVQRNIKNQHRLTCLEKDLLNYPQWTKESIYERGRIMVNDFMNHWDLPFIQETEMRKLVLGDV